MNSRFSDQSEFTKFSDHVINNIIVLFLLNLLRACSHGPGTVNYPRVMIAPGQALSRVHMFLLSRGNVALGQLHCPRASSSKSDHYEFI